MPPRRRARGAARAAAANSAVLLITDLPPDALGHVLARLQYADQIARAAMSCKGFKAAAKLAEDMRLAASPVPLPPQLRTVYELEPRLRVLRWAEAVGAMTKSPEETLTQLKSLHDKGLITDDEYAAKRAEVLARM